MRGQHQRKWRRLVCAGFVVLAAAATGTPVGAGTAATQVSEQTGPATTDPAATTSTAPPGTTAPPPLVCQPTSISDERVPVVIAGGAEQAAEVRAAGAALQAEGLTGDGLTEVTALYLVGPTATPPDEPPPGEQDDAQPGAEDARLPEEQVVGDVDELSEAIKARLAADPTPVAVVVLAPLSREELNREDRLGVEGTAFVIDEPQVRSPDGEVSADGVAADYSSRGERVLPAVDGAIPGGVSDLEVTLAAELAGTVKVDLPTRPLRRGWDAPGATIDVTTADGTPVGQCPNEGPVTLPMTIGGLEAVIGQGVRVTLTGNEHTWLGDTGVAAPEAGPGGEGPTTSAQDGQALDDAQTTRGRSPWIYLAALGLAVLAAAAAAVLLRRREDSAGAGIAGPAWAGGAAPPPSPHGPSSSPSSSGPGMFVGTAPPVPAAPPAPARATLPPDVEAPDLSGPAPGWTAAIPSDTNIRLSDLGVFRIRPTELPAGRTWSMVTSALIGGAGWLEKKQGRGEDAEPSLRLHESGRGLIGVYDGTGGAGAAPARRLRDGSDLSGAFVASRLARELLETWYVTVVRDGRSAADIEPLQAWIAAAFRDEAQGSVNGTAGFKGSLSRVLPTTLAAAMFAPDPGPAPQGGDDRPDQQAGPTRRPGTVVDVVWAGDSRAYLLTPTSGLQVLTVDDTRETDALALIRNDEPLDNLISADGTFVIHHHRLRLEEPAVLVVATDGCFGYVPTPAHFEHLILDRLAAAGSADDWPAGVLQALAEFAGDDVSFALAALGFPRWHDLRQAFTDRHRYVDEVHWAPFRDVAGPESREAERERSWATYRETYGRRMPAR